MTSGKANKPRFSSRSFLYYGAIISILFFGCKGEDFPLPNNSRISDLIPLSNTISTSYIQPGESFSIAGKISNSGMGHAESSTTSYYLSTNTSLDGSDVNIGETAISALAGGGDQNIAETFVLSPSFTTGKYYVLIVADEGSVIEESDEENNIVALPLTIYNPFHLETFESFNTCTPECGVPCPIPNFWFNETGENGDWIIHTGTTLSTNTGPSFDYDPGTATGKYLYIEASDNCYPSSLVTLYSPAFDLSSVSSPRLVFAYHMYGASMGTLNVQVSTNGGLSYSGNLWSKIGDQGDEWHIADIDLSGYSSTQTKIRFQGTTGSSWTSDMAIDFFLLY